MIYFNIERRVDEEFNNDGLTENFSEVAARCKADLDDIEASISSIPGIKDITKGVAFMIVEAADYTAMEAVIKVLPAKWAVITPEAAEERASKLKFIPC